MEILTTISQIIILVGNILLWFVAFKAITIGSDFSFYDWFVFGKRYTDWYFNRPEFKP